MKFKQPLRPGPTEAIYKKHIHHFGEQFELHRTTKNTQNKFHSPFYTAKISRKNDVGPNYRRLPSEILQLMGANTISLLPRLRTVTFNLYPFSDSSQQRKASPLQTLELFTVGCSQLVPRKKWWRGFWFGQKKKL